jgi:hypothetical protein
MIRFDIRFAAREQQAIEGLEQLRPLRRGPECRHQRRYRTRANGYGFNIFLADHVKGMLPCQAAIG